MITGKWLWRATDLRKTLKPTLQCWLLGPEDMVEWKEVDKRVCCVWRGNDESDVADQDLDEIKRTTIRLSLKRF